MKIPTLLLLASAMHLYLTPPVSAVGCPLAAGNLVRREYSGDGVGTVGAGQPYSYDQNQDTKNLLTTNWGTNTRDSSSSLKAGPRGPTLMQDFAFREKLQHFDHERVPERVVHARGYGIRGYFQVYEDLSQYTKASLFKDPSQKTPVFVRFSTVAGSLGSPDTVRDVRGFATKFYTKEGNWDLVGNNIPVFFIQDAIRFPDLVHSFKPAPNWDIPQAATGHDSFWDFVTLTPESTHMLTWIMSDRTLPRSLRMMQGFGVHTFRLINDQGQSHFVKFHWKPKLGVRSFVFDEASSILAADRDFLRRDLYEAVSNGHPAEFELGFQIIDQEALLELGIDLLDPTKLIPEELVPVKYVGKMVLTSPPENFFAEVEQSALHPGRLVPGIEVSDDPLLQGRLFSYQDTLRNRFGNVNFDELPINAPLDIVRNNERDGGSHYTINNGYVNYCPNSLGIPCPDYKAKDIGVPGVFVDFEEDLGSVKKTRSKPSVGFGDHFSQATLFYNSLMPVEQQHLKDSLVFELSHVQSVMVRQRAVDNFNQVDNSIAVYLAQGLGLLPPDPCVTNHGVSSRFLSEILISANDTIETRKIAILVAGPVDQSSITTFTDVLKAGGASWDIVGPRLGKINGTDAVATQTFKTVTSVLYDGVFVPGGGNGDALKNIGAAKAFVDQTYVHLKPIAAISDSVAFLSSASFSPFVSLSSGIFTDDNGVVTSLNGEVQRTVSAFIDALKHHKQWGRVGLDQVSI